MPNSQEAPPTVECRYLTKLAELMVAPHIAQNGSDSDTIPF